MIPTTRQLFGLQRLRLRFTPRSTLLLASLWLDYQADTGKVV